MRNLTAVLILLLAGLPALAGSIIISVDTTDPGSVGALAVDPSNVLAVSWYQPAAQSSVRIRANFLDLFGGGTFSAYLMNGIGPQANLSNELASTTFSASYFGPSPVVLFEHLTLSAGFFYLVLGTTDPGSYGGWAATTNPAVILGPGVLQGDGSGVQFYASGGDVNPLYLPGSNFAIDDLAFGQLMYDVAVPEPSTLLLLLGGGLALALFGRRRTW